MDVVEVLPGEGRLEVYRYLRRGGFNEERLSERSKRVLTFADLELKVRSFGVVQDIVRLDGRHRHPICSGGSIGYLAGVPRRGR